MTKICARCQVEKPRDQYSKGATNKDRLCSYCKTCKAKEDSRRFQENPTQRYRAVNGRRRAQKLWAIEYKGGKCDHCGGVFPPCVYDFHHRDPTQKEVSPKVAVSWSRERYAAELDKCDLLCSNCHRIVHNGGLNVVA